MIFVEPSCNAYIEDSSFAFPPATPFCSMAATIRLNGWRTQLPGQLVRTLGQTRLLLRQQRGQFGDDLWMLAGNVMPLAGIAA